ncbi:ABC transporter permease [Streptomyces sp. 6-11-2]|uniref:ABC transporter permease n=1 Tax=Streptomyces sp. 6-11-2 TaxID=2585753 RepID=UPI00116A6799|nr:ABC transporter permease [Streptomyces sp. 6-11-2]GED89628.1 ABC transporter permease [Streptomyces sp. 6-11-2]
MRWLTFLARRLAALAAVLLVASFLVYGLLYTVPGGPMAFLLGNRSGSPEQIAAIRHQYHLDEPFLVRYFSWLGDALHGDFGQSLVYRQDVSALMSTRLATTGLLVLYATVIIVVVGIALGLLGALRRGPVDAAVSVVNSVFLATPTFVVGVVLVVVFALGLGWFPVFGPGSGLDDRLYHLTLPAIALSLGSAGFLARITRASVGAELSREHVETARSRGFSESHIVRRHVLRNASIPVVTVMGLTVAGLIAGSVVVENIFALDGLGSLLVRAILQRDFAVVQGVVLVLVSAFVIVNLVVDLCYSLIDPRLSPGEAS